MPELPEVETYARDLATVLPGRTFTGARVGWPNQLPRNSPEELAERVAGQDVIEVGRRGKYLRLRLSRDWLLIHLKMSGRLLVVPEAAAPDPHAHVVFGLAGGEELRFHDPRKFGRVYLLEDPEPVLGELGPEPLDDAWSQADFAAALAGRRARLKPLLLDQRVVAGLGNIYVDESLWAARLHPMRLAASLEGAEVERLHGAIREVLGRGVALRGASLRDGGYADLTGNPGEMQGSLAVFGRSGQPCPRCVGGGRGTHVCPRCQTAP
jgi:formamidopyrimidine-DNA glycosylase